MGVALAGPGPLSLDHFIVRRQPKPTDALGYDLTLRETITLRPYVGAGVNFSVTAVYTPAFGRTHTERETNVDLYLNGGLTLLYAVTDAALLGCDLRSTHVVTKEAGLNGVIFMAVVGARF